MQVGGAARDESLKRRLRRSALDGVEVVDDEEDPRRSDGGDAGEDVVDVRPVLRGSTGDVAERLAEAGDERRRRRVPAIGLVPGW